MKIKSNHQMYRTWLVQGINNLFVTHHSLSVKTFQDYSETISWYEQNSAILVHFLWLKTDALTSFRHNTNRAHKHPSIPPSTSTKSLAAIVYSGDMMYLFLFRFIRSNKLINSFLQHLQPRPTLVIIKYPLCNKGDFFLIRKQNDITSLVKLAMSTFFW